MYLSFFRDKGYINFYLLSEDLEREGRINDIFVKYNDSFMKKRNEKLFIGCQVDQQGREMTIIDNKLIKLLFNQHLWKKEKLYSTTFISYPHPISIIDNPFMSLF